jgi:hypothetical protein
LIFLVILVYADALIIEEFPSLWILCNFKLLSNLSKLSEISYYLVLIGNHKLLRDLFEVSSDALHFLYSAFTVFEYFICFFVQILPLFQLFISALVVLFGHVDVFSELIDTLLAVDFTVVGARFDAALILLDLAFAVAHLHFHSLSLITFHYF